MKVRNSVDQHQKYMAEAIDLSRYGMENNYGGPFGAIVVDSSGRVIGRGFNQVTSHKDPTAHAEVVAIRDACQEIESHVLAGCSLYTSCEPCPMCLAATYWARIDRLFYACSREDAAKINFDDSYFYDQVAAAIHERKLPHVQIMQPEGWAIMSRWATKVDKIHY